MANVVQEIHSIEILTQGTAELTQLQTATRNTTRQVNQLKKTTQTGFISRRGTAQIQNASFQIQDLLVQVGSGTSTLRAFSQQAPQFFSAFGPLGAAAGLAAAGFGLLVQTLQNAEKEISSEVITENTNAMREAIDDLVLSEGEAVAQYGEFAELAREANFQALTAGLKEGEEQLKSFSSASAEAAKDIGVELKAIEEASGALQVQATQRLSDLLGIDYADAREIAGSGQLIVDALQGIADAETALERNQGILALREVLTSLGVELTEVEGGIAKLVNENADLAENMQAQAEAQRIISGEITDSSQSTAALGDALDRNLETIKEIEEQKAFLIQKQRLEDMGLTSNRVNAELKIMEDRKAISPFDNDALRESNVELEIQRRELAQVQDELDAAERAARATESAMKALNNQFEALGRAASSMDLEGEILKAEIQALESTGRIEDSVNDVIRLKAAAQFGDLLTASDPEVVREGRRQMSEYIAQAQEINVLEGERAALIEANKDASTGASKAATDGIKDQQKVIEDWKRVLISAYESTRTPAEEAADQINELNAAIKGLSDAGVQIDPQMLQGFNRQMDELTAGTTEFSDSLEQAFGSGFSNLVDDVITSTDSIQDAFNSMLSNILSDIADFLISQQITNFVGLLGNNFSSFGVGSAVSSAIGAGVSAFSGTPALAPANVGGGSYGSYSGSTSGLSVQPVVNVTNNTPANVSTSQGFDGRSLDIVVENAVSRNLASGGLDRAFQQNYGLRRSPT